MYLHNNSECMVKSLIYKLKTTIKKKKMIIKSSRPFHEVLNC